LSEQLCLPVDGSRRPPVFLQTAINVGVNAGLSRGQPAGRRMPRGSASDVF
jgi:hypothetical protein